MGSSSKGTDTTTTSSQPNQAFLDAYKNIFSRAQTVAATPYTQYGGQMVADLSPDQLQAMQQVRDSQGIAAPYINSAASYYDKANAPLGSTLSPFTNAAGSYFNASGNTDLTGTVSPWQTQAASGFGSGSAAITPAGFSANAVNQYASPYTNSVVNATQAQFNNTNAQQQNDLTGNLISKGAWGGDRAGIAKAVLAGQQQTAQAPVIAGLYNQGYSQALNEFNQQQGVNLSADAQSRALALQGAQGYTALGNQALGAAGQQAQLQQGAGAGIAGLGGQALGAATTQAGLGLQTGYGMSALGNQALTSSLAGANALASSGATQQQQAQAGLNVPYYQWQAQQAYPFQTTSWLSGIGTGLGGASGGTSSTSAPAPSTVSQLGGLALGATGLIGGTGGFGSNGWLTNLFSKRGGAVPDEPRGILIPFPGHRVRRAAGGSLPSSPLVTVNPSSYAGGIGVPMLRTGTDGGNSTQDYLNSQVPGWNAPPPVSYNFPTVDFNPSGSTTGGAGTGGLDATGVAARTESGSNGGAGATDQGFNGSVSNFGDFASAVASGLGAVFGGPLGAAGFVGALAASNGKTGSPSKAAISAIKDLFGTPTSTSSSVDGLSGKEIEVNPDVGAGGFGTGAMAGLAGGVGGMSGPMGDITGGATNSLSGGDNGGGLGGGPDIGAQGDATAEARGMRRGGPLHRDAGGLLPTTPWGDLDPGLVSGNTPDFADPIDQMPPDTGDNSSVIDVSGTPVGISTDPRGEAPWQAPSGGLAAATGPGMAPQGGGLGAAAGPNMGIPPPPPVPPGAPDGGDGTSGGGWTPAATEDPMLKADPWLSVAKAGFAMAAGKSPHALTNIGAGAMAGLTDLQQQKQIAAQNAVRREAVQARKDAVQMQREWRAASAQQAAEKLAAQIDHQNKQLAISGGHLGETQRHNQVMEEQAGRPNYIGTDDEGNAIVADKTGVHATGVRVGARPMNEYQTAQLAARQDTIALARDRFNRAVTNDQQKVIKGMTDQELATTRSLIGAGKSVDEAIKGARTITGGAQANARSAAPAGAAPPPAANAPAGLPAGARQNGAGDWFVPDGKGGWLKAVQTGP